MNFGDMQTHTDDCLCETCSEAYMAWWKRHKEEAYETIPVVWWRLWAWRMRKRKRLAIK